VALRVLDRLAQVSLGGAVASPETGLDAGIGIAFRPGSGQAAVLEPPPAQLPAELPAEPPPF